MLPTAAPPIGKVLVRRGTVGAVAGLTALLGLQVPAHAQSAVPDDQAGGILGWGATDTTGSWSPLEDLADTPFSAIAAGKNFSVVLTSTGHLISTSDSPTFQLDEDDDLQKVTATAVAAGPTDAAAVTKAGTVVLWGAGNVPATDLTGVADVALGTNWGIALKTDHTVVGWGDNTNGQITIPSGLEDVEAIAAGDQHAYALKDDGTVVPWGNNTNGQTTLPPELTDATDDIDVIAIEARANGGLALLSNHTVRSWGFATTVPPVNAVPTSLNGKTILAISVSNETNLALDSTGGITSWGLTTAPHITGIQAGATELDDVDLDDVTDIAIGDGYGLALVKQVLLIAQPTVSGTAKVGSTLTGTPARFSGTPATTTNQWLADGSPIPGATGTTLKLTNAQAGKRISYRSMATTAGDPVPATSSATAPVAAAPTSPVVTTVASKTKITKAKAKKHGKKVIIKVKVTAPGTTPTGKVKVVIKKGKKKASKTTTKLNAKGIAKIKITNKKKLTKKGKYKVTATYKGATTIKPSKTKTTYKV